MKQRNFVIIGGDKRQKFLGDYLNYTGQKAENYGLYDWDECKDRLKSIITPESIIMLPLPVSKNGKTVFMPFSKRELSLDRLLSVLTDKNKVFGGIISEEFSEKLKEKGIAFYDYYDSEFISENAFLTAFGTLKIILEHIDFAVSAGKFAITGYGRVGRETAEILKRLSCDVTVFARDESARENAAMHGLRALPVCELSNTAAEFDIIINTVPCRIIDEKTLRNMRNECKIIELASSPFGTDPKEAEKYSVSIIKAPGLPGKYTAKTAGELIGKKTVKILRKEEENER